MTQSDAKAWKFWMKTAGHMYCFIVTVDDPEEAEAKLQSREAVGEILDRERLPSRVYEALGLAPNEVIGFKSLNM